MFGQTSVVVAEHDVTRAVMGAARALNAMTRKETGQTFDDLARAAADCGRRAGLDIKAAIGPGHAYDLLVLRIINVAFRSL